MPQIRARENLRFILAVKALLTANADAFERLLSEAGADAETIREVRYLVEREKKIQAARERQTKGAM